MMEKTETLYAWEYCKYKAPYGSKYRVLNLLKIYGNNCMSAVARKFIFFFVFFFFYF